MHKFRTFLRFQVDKFYDLVEMLDEDIELHGASLKRLAGIEYDSTELSIKTHLATTQDSRTALVLLDMSRGTMFMTFYISSCNHLKFHKRRNSW